MICCGQCGARNFKAEGEREAELAELAALFRLVLVQRNQPQGHLAVGTGPTGSLEWARKSVAVRIEREPGWIVLRWDSPPLNELPEAAGPGPTGGTT